MSDLPDLTNVAPYTPSKGNDRCSALNDYQRILPFVLANDAYALGMVSGHIPHRVDKSHVNENSSSDDLKDKRLSFLKRHST